MLSALVPWNPAAATPGAGPERAPAMPAVRALALARKAGARTVTEHGTPELNQALVRATMVAKEYGAVGVLVLPADLPLLSEEDIRNLIDQVRIAPQLGTHKVYIIDEVHMLSTSAFNAFLKTLEEPPKHAIFILATTEKHKIIPTILSRCQIFDFNRIKSLVR